MIEEQKIKEILQNSQLGSTQLEFEYKKLGDLSERNQFLNLIKKILKHSSEGEKAICYTFVNLIRKTAEFKEFIEDEIDQIKMSQNPSFINSLLWLAVDLSEKKHLNFVIAVIKNFKPLHGEYSYLYNMGIRSLVSTHHWRLINNEIRWIVENFNDPQIIDFLAYFKWKQGESVYNELFQELINDNFLKTKLIHLVLKIDERYTNNYNKLTNRN